jgi:hypothetical protein
VIGGFGQRYTSEGLLSEEPGNFSLAGGGAQDDKKQYEGAIGTSAAELGMSLQQSVDPRRATCPALAGARAHDLRRSGYTARLVLGGGSQPNMLAAAPRPRLGLLRPHAGRQAKTPF